MRPTTPVLKLPFPAFQVGRYAAIAGKITAESKTADPPAADSPASADDAHKLANITSVDGYEPDDAAARMSGLDAAANLISLSEHLNAKLQASLDIYF